MLRAGAVSMMSRVRLTIYHIESSIVEPVDTEQAQKLAMQLSEENSGDGEEDKDDEKPTEEEKGGEDDSSVVSIVQSYN